MHFRFPSHARRGLSSLLLLAFVAVSSCFAQQFATLNIAVVDPAGSAIAQARISVRNIDTGAIRTTDSDKTGAAAIPGLPAGQYKVTVEADSFATYEAPLLLTLGQVADVQVPLHIRTAMEQVEVSASTPGVERERTGGSQVIAPAQIANLPISDRDFIDFVLLTPTATIGRDVSTGAQSAFQETVLQVSFGGLRETHSVFYGLDGVDYTTTVSGVQRVSPSLDWVQEVRVVDGPDATGGGLNLGAAVNTITQSGTNDLHGTLYEYARNSAIDATNLLSAPGFHTLRFNQFGATSGGPVRKDKDFFFAGYEGQRRAESPIYSHFILKCIDTEGCLGPGTPSINEVKQRLGLAPENLGSFLQVNDYDKGFGKFTAVLSENSTLSAGFARAKAWCAQASACTPGRSNTAAW